MACSKVDRLLEGVDPTLGNLQLTFPDGESAIPRGNEETLTISVTKRARLPRRRQTGDDGARCPPVPTGRHRHGREVDLVTDSARSRVRVASQRPDERLPGPVPRHRRSRPGSDRRAPLRERARKRSDSRSRSPRTPYALISGEYRANHGEYRRVNPREASTYQRTLPRESRPCWRRIRRQARRQQRRSPLQTRCRPVPTPSPFAVGQSWLTEQLARLTVVCVARSHTAARPGGSYDPVGFEHFVPLTINRSNYSGPVTLTADWTPTGLSISFPPRPRMCR